MCPLGRRGDETARDGRAEIALPTIAAPPFCWLGPAARLPLYENAWPLVPAHLWRPPRSLKRKIPSAYTLRPRLPSKIHGGSMLERRLSGPSSLWPYCFLTGSAPAFKQRGMGPPAPLIPCDERFTRPISMQRSMVPAPGDQHSLPRPSGTIQPFTGTVPTAPDASNIRCRGGGTSTFLVQERQYQAFPDHRRCQDGGLPLQFPLRHHDAAGQARTGPLQRANRTDGRDHRSRWGSLQARGAPKNFKIFKRSLPRSSCAQGRVH